MSSTRNDTEMKSYTGILPVSVTIPVKFKIYFLGVA